MKHSIKRQMAFMFIGLMVLVLAGNWLINNIFLEDYYIGKKKTVLVEAYEFINQVTDAEGYLDDDFRKGIGDLCNANNIMLVIAEIEAGEAATYYDQGGVDSKLLLARLWAYIYGNDISEVNIMGISETNVIEETADYTVQKVWDNKEKTDYLEIWGDLDQDFYFLMRIPINSIRENVKISNEFLAYFSIVGVLLSVCVIWFLSKKITNPIRELTLLSQRMSELDFNVKYHGKGRNEIDLLGERFNKMSETLEEKISELKTANNELQIDIEKKEQIDEMRKEFLANVSHELKTPIALIQGYAEGLKENINDDEDSREFYCEVIMDEASKMNQMVKKLLTLNQLEFGNDTVTMERFNISELVKGVIQSASILANQKEARIMFQNEGDIYAWADEYKIEEVVTNYISNALNHVDYEKVIDVRVIQDGQKVRVSVFNTGKPIPEEDLDNIWIKFYKVDKARTREYGGSGIGLSIVKAIMDSFHQKCGVRNYDNGVEFWFELDGAESQSLE